MLTRMRNKWRMIQKQNYRISKESFDELTRSSWAIHIASYDAVPHVYKSFFESLDKEGRKFPYTVLTPSYERFMHRTTEKLICDLASEIWVLESHGNTFETQCYPLEGISCIEVKAVLLDSYIKISGETKPGVLACSTLKFNSVSDYLFTPLLERIRLASVTSRGAIQGPELEKFDHLARSNYKFMNYAKRSLLGGEKVLHTVLQPEIRVRVLAILGKSYDWMISPTHMIILTDQELIIIREEARRRGKERYGGIWDYIPISKINNISLIEKNNTQLAFSIQLPGSTYLELLYEASARPEIDQLLKKFVGIKVAR